MMGNSGNQQKKVFRRISLGEIDNSPTEKYVSLDVEVIRSIISSNRPGRIRIEMCNKSSDDQEIHTEYMPVFGDVWSEEQDPGLILVPPETPIEFGENPFRPDISDVVVDTPIVKNNLKIGDSKSIEFDVWDCPNNTGNPLVPGKYRFESTYIHPQKSEGDVAETFDWGFELIVCE